MDINFKASIIFLLLDFIWIFINLDKYKNLVSNIQSEPIDIEYRYFTKFNFLLLLIFYYYMD